MGQGQFRTMHIGSILVNSIRLYARNFLRLVGLTVARTGPDVSKRAVAMRYSKTVSVSVLLAVVLVGCAAAPPESAERQWEPHMGEKVVTKHYFLWGPFAFGPTDFGTVPKVQSHGGGPWWLPLDQCETSAKVAQVPHRAYVTQTWRKGRLEEIGLWYEGVMFRRFAFRYDAEGRPVARVDTEYEARREDEGPDEWAKRLRGRIPEVARITELAYERSPGGRTVTARTASSRSAGSLGLRIHDVEIFYGWPDVQTWSLDDDGHVVDVHSGGDLRYAATYDGAGRLLTEHHQGHERTQHTYDTKGRVVTTQVNRVSGSRMVFVHGYPDAPAPALPEAKGPGWDETYVVTHDESGHVTSVVLGEGASFPDKPYRVRFVRDREGRVTTVDMGLLGTIHF